jgi:hypothetical protein
MMSVTFPSHTITAEKNNYKEYVPQNHFLSDKHISTDVVISSSRELICRQTVMK